jgi:hypothetical protein
MGSTDRNLKNPKLVNMLPEDSACRIMVPERPAPRQYKLAVLRFPGNNAEHPASSGWVIAQMPKWLKDRRISEVIPLRRSDTPITMVRNLLVKAALDKGADYILMIDSDMEPDVEPDGKPFWDTSWEFMMERRGKEEEYALRLATQKDWDDENSDDWILAHIGSECFKRYPPATIAAPYCGPPPNECVYVMKWTQPEGNTPQARPFKLTMFDRDHAATFAGIFEVAALPTGLILYDARVFRRLPPPWFEYEFSDAPSNTTKSCTEDIYQTRNASLAGMPQFCNWDAWAGHIKLKVVRKPRPVTVESIPDAMADAIRKGTRGDRQVTVLSSPEDGIGRPRQIQAAPSD